MFSSYLELIMTEDLEFLTEVLDLKTAKGYDYKVSPKEDWPAWPHIKFQAVFTADNGVEYAFRVVREKAYGKTSKRLILMKKQSKNYSQNLILDKGTFKKVLVTFMRCYQAFKDTDEGLRSSSYGLTLQKGLIPNAPLLVRTIAKAFRGQPKVKLELVGVNEEGPGGGIDLLYVNKISTVPYWGGKEYDEAKFTSNDTFKKLANIKTKSDAEPNDSDVSVADATGASSGVKPTASTRMDGLSKEAVAVTKEENWGPALFSALNAAKGRDDFADILRKFSVHRHYMKKHFGEMYNHLYGTMDKAIQNVEFIKDYNGWVEGMGFYLEQFSKGATTAIYLLKMTDTTNSVTYLTRVLNAVQPLVGYGTYDTVAYLRLLSDKVSDIFVTEYKHYWSQGEVKDIEALVSATKVVYNSPKISLSKSNLVKKLESSPDLMLYLVATGITSVQTFGVLIYGSKGVSVDGRTVTISKDADSTLQKNVATFKTLYDLPDLVLHQDASDVIEELIGVLETRGVLVFADRLLVDLTKNGRPRTFYDEVKSKIETTKINYDRSAIESTMSEYSSSRISYSAQSYASVALISMAIHASETGVVVKSITDDVLRVLEKAIIDSPGLSDRLDGFMEKNTSVIWPVLLNNPYHGFKEISKLLGDLKYSYADEYLYQYAISNFHRYVDLQFLKDRFDAGLEVDKANILMKMAQRTNAEFLHTNSMIWDQLIEYTGVRYSEFIKFSGSVVAGSISYTEKYLWKKVDQKSLTDEEMWASLVRSRSGLNGYDLTGRSDDFKYKVFAHYASREEQIKETFTPEDIKKFAVQMATGIINKSGGRDITKMSHIMSYLGDTHPDITARLITSTAVGPLHDYPVMVFSETIDRLHKSKPVMDAYAALSPEWKKEIYVKLIEGRMNKAMMDTIQGDGLPIKPFMKLDRDRLKQILKYNEFKYPRRPKFKESEGLDEVMNKSFNLPEIPDLKVAKIEKTEQQLEEMSVEYDAFNRYRHGDIAVRFLEEFDVSLPNEFEEWGARFEQAHGNKSEYMYPVFHGTGSVAASMILRNGFTIIKSTDSSVAGRMLGDGIYFSNVLDKVSQYVSEQGITRGRGAKGYIFEMEAWLGRPRLDYSSAGTGTAGDTRHSVVSPEWCVYNLNQLRIKKAYKIEIVDKTVMEELKSKRKVNEGQIMGIRQFRHFLGEVAGIKIPRKKYTKTYVFMDGKIPVGDGKWVEFEKFDAKKYGPNVRTDISKQGPCVVIGSDEQETYLVRFVEDMLGDKHQLAGFLLALKGKA